MSRNASTKSAPAPIELPEEETLPPEPMTAADLGMHATSRAGARAASKQVIKQFRISTPDGKPRPIMYRGNRTEVHPGKVVDERSYDIQQLRMQGVQLEELEPIRI